MPPHSCRKLLGAFGLRLLRDAAVHFLRKRRSAAIELSDHVRAAFVGIAVWADEAIIVIACSFRGLDHTVTIKASLDANCNS